MVKFTYLKLRGRIVEKYRTLEAFAEAIGVSVVSVSKKLNAKSQFTQKDIILWSRALDIPETEISDFYFS